MDNLEDTVCKGNCIQSVSQKFCSSVRLPKPRQPCKMEVPFDRAQLALKVKWRLHLTGFK